MGQARKRGTREERVALAIQKKEEREKLRKEYDSRPSATYSGKAGLSTAIIGAGIMATMVQGFSNKRQLVL